MKLQMFVVLALVVVILVSVAEGGHKGKKKKKHKKKNEMLRDWAKPWLPRNFEFESPRAPRRAWNNMLNRWFKNRRYRFGIGPPDDRWLDFDMGWNFGQREKPWWEGPNICKSRIVSKTNSTEEEDGTISRHFSFQSKVCDETDSAYKCTTTSTINNKKKIVTEVFECCHGYTRKETEFGCPRELKLKNLVETAKKLGLTEFIRATDSVDMTEELRQGNFTVFAPVNSAWKDKTSMSSLLPTLLLQDMPYTRTFKDNVVMVSKPSSDLVVSDMRNLLLGHLTVGQLKTSAMHDEQLIETGSPYKSHIRINFYNTPQKLITANCIPLVTTDTPATNGVIHSVDGILQPVTLSLLDMVSKNPDLSFLKTALGRANTIQLKHDGQFTLFAPSDEAFRKMSPRLQDRLLKGDSGCLETVLKNHILPNVICAKVIQGKVKTTNLLHKYLSLIRDKDDKLFVEGSQITAKDVMATNGVLYTIDDVLIPDEALDVLDIAQKNGHGRVLGLLKQAKLLQEIQKEDNITFFVPTNKAIEDLPEKTLRMFENDPEELRRVLQYHVVKPELRCSHLRNNYLLDTLLDGKKIRINDYTSFPFSQNRVQTAQCVPIKKQNLEACNGVVNVIDTVLFPPVGNVIDVLAQDKKFSRMVSLLKKAGLADVLQEDGPFTVFAPSNQAFEDLDTKEMKKLENNPDNLRSFLNNHIVQGVLCCSGIFENNWRWFGNPKVATMSGETIPLDRTQNGIKIGHADVAKCDITATNGVVQQINRVLVSREMEREWNPAFGDFWDF